MRAGTAALVLIFACDTGGAASPEPAIDASAPPPFDASPADAGPPCAPHGLFGAPVEVPGLHRDGEDVLGARLADDGLSAILTRGSPPKLYFATRSSVAEPFVVGAEIADGAHGTLADDGQTLFFEGADGDIHLARRGGSGVPFGASEPAPVVSTAAREGHPFFVGDALYFEREDDAGVRIVRARWTGTSFEDEIDVAGFAGAATPAVSRPEDRLFVTKPNADGGTTMYVTTRTSDAGIVFTGFFPLGDLGGAAGCVLYLARDADGGRRVYAARRSR